MRNVLADLAIESEAATVLAHAPRARLRRVRATGPSFKRLATAVASTTSASARPNHAYEALECLGGNGYVEESRHAAPLPRGAAVLDLGGLGQRDGARRPARAERTPGGARGLLRRGRRGRRRRRAPRRVRRVACATEFTEPRRRSRRAPGGSSSAWRSRCRARCSSATRRRRSPTRSAPRASPATPAWTTARCRPAPTSPRSSSATRRLLRNTRALFRHAAGATLAACVTNSTATADFVTRALRRWRRGSGEHHAPAASGRRVLRARDRWHGRARVARTACIGCLRLRCPQSGAGIEVGGGAARCRAGRGAESHQRGGVLRPPAGARGHRGDGADAPRGAMRR